MTPLDAAASVVLLEFQQSYGLGFVAPNGRIITCFHVVADEKDIVAHLADGRVLPVRSVCALDTRRDLAVLDVDDLGRSATGGGRGEHLTLELDPVAEVILALADLVADVATSLRAFADDRSRSWPADQAGASEAAARTGGAAAPDSAGGAAAPPVLHPRAWRPAGRRPG